MIEKVLNIIKENKLIKENCNIFVGFSGGGDSVCLTEILYRIKEENLLGYDFNLKCVHVNHKLYGEDSDNDEAYAIKYCNERNIEILVYSEQVKELSKELKMTVEEAGRKVRYEIFQSLLKSENDKIAIAHHLSDNAETMLMHLFRGCGLNGLVAMDYDNNNIIRPLIKSTKKDILCFLEKNNIHYQTDKTNFEEVYQRNKVRLSLLPYIEKNFNKNIIESLNNTIDALKIDNNFIEQTASIEYENLSKVEYYKNQKMILLNIKKLKKLHESIFTRIFFMTHKELCGNNVDLNRKNIEDLKKLLNGETGKKIILGKQISAFKGYEYIYFILGNNIYVNEDFKQTLELNKLVKIDNSDLYIHIGKELKTTKYKLIKSKYIFFDEEQVFYLRNRRINDKIYIKNINGHKNLKKYFVDEKIDEIFRNDIKLLTNSNNLIMILDKNLISTDNFSNGRFEYCIQLFID